MKSKKAIKNRKKFSPLAVIDPGAGVVEAAKKMRTSHVGDLIVVEKVGDLAKPVGILTDRDIVLATIAVGCDPETLLVRDIMSPNPVTAKDGVPTEYLISLMNRSGVTRIPLLGPKGELVGIVTSTDLLAWLSEDLLELFQATRHRAAYEKDFRPGRPEFVEPDPRDAH